MTERLEHETGEPVRFKDPTAPLEGWLIGCTCGWEVVAASPRTARRLALRHLGFGLPA